MCLLFFIGHPWIQFVNSSCTIKAFLCLRLVSFFTFRILWFAVTISTNVVVGAIPSTRCLGFIRHTCSYKLWFPLGWEPMMPFLLLVYFVRVSLRSGDNWWKFLIKSLFFDNFMLGVTPSSRSWGRCTSFLSSFCKCFFLRIQHGVLHFFFPLMVSLGCGEFHGWYCFVFGGCHHVDEVFDAAFDHFLTFWQSGTFSSRTSTGITKFTA